MEVGIYKEKRPIKEEYLPQAKEFQCQSCGKILKSRKAWKDHLRIHTGEKPHKCTFEGCGKAFIQYSSLQKHLRAHKGEKPYKCQSCGKEFSQICNLKRHERLHSGEKPFTCPICSRTFTTSSNLKQHLDTHDQTLYKCSVCGKDYHNVRSFKKHMKIHAVDNKDIAQKNFVEGNDEKVLLTKRASPIELNYEPIKLVKAEAQVQPMRLKSVPLITEENNIFEEEREFRVGHSYFEEEISLKENEIPLINTSEQGRKPPFNPSECLIIRHYDHNDYLYQGKLMHLKENGEWEEHELEASEQNPSVCKPLKEMTHVPNFSDLTAKYKSLIEENKGVLTTDMLSNSCNVLLCGGCNNGNETSTGGGCSCSSEKGSGCCGSKASNPQMPELSKQKSGCCSNKVENPPKKSCCSSKQEEVPKSTGCCSGKSENKAVGDCCSGGCKCSLPKQEKDLKEKIECDDSGFVKKFSSCLCSETKSFKHRHSEFCGHPIIFHDGHIDYIVGNQLHHVHDGHCDDHGIIFIVEKNELKSKEENNHLGLLEENYSEL